ncbi:MAG TPA: 30S ribosomal protein S27e [archaeon]|nr:30S ribosomal protein S27e [archaeon]
MLSELIPKPKTKFLRLKCPSCGNEQNVFSAASSKVKCLVCATSLAETTASRIKVKAKILKEFE